MSNERGAEQVECRLTINGQVIEFTLPGRLVEMAPAGEKTEKRPARRRGAK
jgi:hypothetical protein